MDYSERKFGVPWLDCGLVREHIEDGKTPLSLLRETFTTFQGSDEYALIIKAMKDWNQWIDGQWSGMKHDEPGYLIRMGQLQAMRRYMSWFQKLIIDLKGLEEAPADGEDQRPDSIENYV